MELEAGYLFFQPIFHPYDKGSVLISSKRPVDERVEMHGDEMVMITAIRDHLLHHSLARTTSGDSYWLKETRGSEPFRRQASDSTSSGINGT